MAIDRANFVHRYVLIIFVLSTVSPRSQASIRHPETVLCPQNRKVNPEEPCNTTTNCRFGGECRQAADVSSRGIVTRYIIPQEGEYKVPDLDERVVFDRLKEYSRNTGTTRTEVCNCHFQCDSFKSKTVCGTNGINYNSVCHLRRNSCRCQMDIRVAHIGPCGRVVDAATALAPYIPTPKLKLPMGDCRKMCHYGGGCDSEGRCQCHINCPSVDSFVCDKDGNTHKNRCFLRRAQCEEQRGIAIRHNGRCRSSGKHRRFVPSCSYRCDTSTQNPVCGSDKVTYSSECHMKRTSCMKRQQIKVLHEGPCGRQYEVTPEPTPDPCRDIECEFGAICVPDEVSEFMCSCDAICNQKDAEQNDNLVRLTVDSSPSIRQKRVDSDREEQIRNRRRRRRRRRKNRKNRNHRSRRSIDGASAPRNVTLCGMDGKTYTNLCEMKNYACHQQKIIGIKHVGPCPMRMQVPPDRTIANSKITDVEEITSEDIEKIPMNDPTRRHNKGHQLPKRPVFSPIDAEGELTTVDDVAHRRTETTPQPVKGGNGTGELRFNNKSVQIVQLHEDDERRLANVTAGTAIQDSARFMSSSFSSTSATSTSQSSFVTDIDNRPGNTIAKHKPSREQNLGRIERLLHLNQEEMKINKTGETDDKPIKGKETRGENSEITRCQFLRPASPSLQWYHVALISVATQIFLTFVIIGVCILLKRRKVLKHTQETSKSSSAAEVLHKEKYEAENEKT